MVGAVTGVYVNGADITHLLDNADLGDLEYRLFNSYLEDAADAAYERSRDLALGI